MCDGRPSSATFFRRTHIQQCERDVRLIKLGLSLAVVAALVPTLLATSNSAALLGLIVGVGIPGACWSDWRFSSIPRRGIIYVD